MNSFSVVFDSTYKRQGGFAYLWTLLLIAFLGVGLALGSEIYSTSLTREKEKELLFIGREFRNAIGRYYESNVAGGRRQYPATMEELLKDPRSASMQRYLRRIYIDPMTGKSEWGKIIVKGRIVGIHSLSEKKPIKQDRFEPSDAAFKGKEKYSEWAFTYPSDLLLTQQKGVESAQNVTDSISSEKPLSSQANASNKETIKPDSGKVGQ